MSPEDPLARLARGIDAASHAHQLRAAADRLREWADRADRGETWPEAALDHAEEINEL